MSKYGLEARVLRKIPKKFLAGRVYDEAEAAPLERDWGRHMSDPYHVDLQVRSRYCSMDELKAYILSARPELDMSRWSVAHLPDGGVNVSVPSADLVIPVPPDVYKSLATDHVDSCQYDYFQEGWELELDPFSAGWLAPLLPGYLDRDLVRRAMDHRMSAAKRLDKSALADRISEYGWSGTTGRTDVLGFLSDCLAYRPAGAVILLRRSDGG